MWQRSSKLRTSQFGFDTCKCESHRNVRVSTLYACPFLLHVVQFVLEWGKDPVVVVKREEGSKYKASVAPEEREITPINMQWMTNVFMVSICMRKMTREVEYFKSMI